MKQQTLEDIIQQLDDELSLIKTQSANTIEIIEAAIGRITYSLIEIRELVIQFGFKTNEDEIRFFKHTKPKVLSKLMFYMKLMEIESYRYNEIEKYQIKYLNNILKELHQFIDSKHELKQYLVRGKNHMDELYFLRENNKNQLQPDNICIFLDHKFSTTRDNDVAKYHAYEMLIKYVDNEIFKLMKATELAGKEFSPDSVSDFKWTGTLIGFVELLYAVHSVGVINGGSKDIKEIATTFEKVLNIDLGDFYRTFQIL